ncbi:MAG TPA: serine/threonine-protein kinase [Kofleriaceae bacterium]|nr:serine/threonine-protein kinase [Kofleriaceae bacterium]
MSEPPIPDEAFEDGRVLAGRYRIEGRIGGGGMAHVYRAQHLELLRGVAVKVLHAAHSQNREAVLRFRREAAMARRLGHPNIVTIIDSGVLEDGRELVVMEALDGETLEARIARERRIPWRVAVSLLGELLLGLCHAHEHGVVHRDIKPSNIFLLRGEGPKLKLLDFGAAKLYTNEPASTQITQRGVTIGAPLYMSPEQALAGEIVPASDLYSTTVVLFEMLTGELPFLRGSATATMKAHVFARPPKLRDAAPDLEVPAELEEIVRRGLAKLPVGRIRTAEAYLKLLEELTAAHPGQSG